MHSEPSQRADKLSSTSADTAPLLGAAPPSLFHLPSSPVPEAPSDSCEVPKSNLQPETGQAAASS